MPKITDYHSHGYTVPVHYRLKSRDFSILLPTEMSGYSLLKDGKIFSETQEKVQVEFDKIVNSFIKDGAERKKFIAIAAEDDSRYDDEFSRAHGSEGYLKLQYAIVTRVTINEKYHYKYSVASGFSSEREMEFWSNDETVYIEWTAEREAFLKKTVDAIKEIAANVKKFVGNDVATLIDSKQTNLLLIVKREEKCQDQEKVNS